MSARNMGTCVDGNSTQDEVLKMTDEERKGSEELVIAVYLDTNVLLDLLATVEDGFRLVERVTTGQTLIFHPSTESVYLD
jgi:hypothetical protein